VVGALDAFVTGSERRVDLGSLNGRVFVNNVSMGLYAEAVSHQGYRSAKLRTILDTAPEMLSPEPSIRDFTWSGPSGQEMSGAVVMLVSNNSYRLGVRLGAGTRPRMDAGVLGIAAMLGPSGEARLQRWRLPWRAWTVQSLRVDSNGPVPVGIDGESQTFEPPLEFTSRPKALRVRIAIAHPGVSPSAGLPEGFLDGLRRLISIAGGN
ncbi:MAG: diacylglycerol kinase, partial [Actinomycetes bacterium]